MSDQQPSWPWAGGGGDDRSDPARPDSSLPSEPAPPEPHSSAAPEPSATEPNPFSREGAARQPDPVEPHSEYGSSADATPAAPPADASAGWSAPYGSSGFPPAYRDEPYPDLQQPVQPDPYARPAIYPGYPVQPPQHPQATTALVTGIIGLAICPFVGIAALVTGGRARREIQENPGTWSGGGLVTAGWVLGILSVISACFFVIGILIALLGGFDS